MSKVKEFCKRKNIEVSAKRYGVDALGAMAQGLFCSLLIGTIISTIGQQAGIDIKSLQYLMGHSNASVTLDVYTHTDYNVVKRAFDQAAASL